MDFEAELAKFQPSLEIDQAEDAIYGNNTTDVTDLLQSILKDEKAGRNTKKNKAARSEAHTSELQSPVQLVCRLLLE